MKSSGKRSHEVGPRDVICQRGSFGNLHPMNKSYLEKRDEMIPHYLLAEKQRDKTIISRLLVNWVHHQGGQFIKFDRSTKTWQEISEKEALKKASQALREGILYFRRVILQDDDANDDEKRNCCPEQPVKGRALESEQDAVSEPEEKQSIIQGKDKDCEESPSSSENFIDHVRLLLKHTTVCSARRKSIALSYRLITLKRTQPQIIIAKQQLVQC